MKEIFRKLSERCNQCLRCLRSRIRIDCRNTTVISEQDNDKRPLEIVMMT